MPLPGFWGHDLRSATARSGASTPPRSGATTCGPPPQGVGPERSGAGRLERWL